MSENKGRIKPDKPRPDFPLTAHPSGQWCKKIHGKLYWFGPWRDPEAALERYIERRDMLYAGIDKPAENPAGVTVRYLCNAFLTSKRLQVEQGELAEVTFKDYEKAAKRFVAFTGPSRPISTLSPQDFDNYRKSWPETWGAKRQTNEIIRLNPIIRYAYDASLVEQPIRVGFSFRRPSQKTLRKERASRAPKFFPADQVRQLIAAAPAQLKAMIHLGVNAGLGNADCGRLTWDQIDWKTGWLSEPRHKTGVWRSAWLWPETLAALDAVRRQRGNHQSELVFLTKRKAPWWTEHNGGDSISPEFRKLCQAVGVYQRGVGFYSLRHITQTIGEQTPGVPPISIKIIMGHADQSISETYRESFDKKPIKKVCQHLRTWLFAKEKNKPKDS